MLDAQKTFNALIREATFTKEVLGAGATQIRVANYSTPGVYAQAFSALSVGFERIGKLCLMLDYYIDNNGKFPEFSYLKKEIGHKLEVLLSGSTEIIVRRKIKLEFLDDLNHPLHQAISQVLHDYAEGDRYTNINILTNGKMQNDPIAAWSKTVDDYIYNNLIGEKRKITIRNNATLAHAMVSEFSVVRHNSETGENISSYFDASFLTGKYKAVSPYRQLYVLQMIRYWTELLWELGRIAQSLGREEIPYFGDIFGGFYNSDNFFKSRKRWIF
ncbi:hypothetical protein VM94_00885 [Janthinobacterium sp. KBS0711]|uniref:hypothetical protein n=1 Tax=Janthinobacterium sp. KBS0711 TaxID=1649647 RepID=UPI000639DBB4|nr:hypothetical protein [Janthinobacterium sp. KBS0711]KKO65350.1 hypothetical protein VM94_00885 [Janthinobacterium sp. KBS0711]TSD71184.1 hypothetical protein FFI39_009360 [Janthinobacterium sp. KBS0711]